VTVATSEGAVCGWRVLTAATVCGPLNYAVALALLVEMGAVCGRRVLTATTGWPLDGLDLTVSVPPLSLSSSLFFRCKVAVVGVGLLAMASVWPSSFVISDSVLPSLTPTPTTAGT
jgi:hypothetical protein